MLGKRTRPFWKSSSKFRPMDCTSKASTIKVPFVHVNTDQDGPKSPKSPLEIKSSCLKSPRGWQKKDSEGVGLGILAAMSNANVGNDGVIASKASITAIQAAPVKIVRASAPIPIVSAKASPRFRDTRAESELSESYTCVIARCGPNSVRKHEYFHETNEEKPIEIQWSFDSSAFLCSSPPRFQGAIFHSNDFLNCCYLCTKNLQGKDVYMYRGDKAFCSVECRYQQIVNDEYREKHGSTEAMVKPMDCSAASPCSSPRLFYAGVAVA